MARLSRIGSFNLFTACAFPIHLWGYVFTIGNVIEIYAIGEIADTIALASYSVAFTLFESVLFFLVVFSFSLFMPQAWEGVKLLALTNTAALLVAAWVGLSRSLFIVDRRLEGIRFFPLSNEVAIALFAIAISSSMIFLVLIFRRRDIQLWIVSFIDRMSILIIIYIGIDIVGILIVVYRNIGKVF